MKNKLLIGTLALGLASSMISTNVLANTETDQSNSNTLNEAKTNVEKNKKKFKVRDVEVEVVLDNAKVKKTKVTDEKGNVVTAEYDKENEKITLVQDGKNIILDLRQPVQNSSVNQQDLITPMATVDSGKETWWNGYYNIYNVNGTNVWNYAPNMKSGTYPKSTTENSSNKYTLAKIGKYVNQMKANERTVELAAGGAATTIITSIVLIPETGGTSAVVAVVSTVLSSITAIDAACSAYSDHWAFEDLYKSLPNK
ncbi:geobacillin-26 family protein [Aneurinibacillus aneurinilyticus]|jgi:hypothetical protein|uniref:Uncharacterized protein n=1 Tax=Aneurinibacillus aneurinilyticus ATCC 12856 TaxID=649747 RepID=U1YL39_ANEAE|nr:geobacillin-26 family protein [Aneurinibacillus aneurinilyticus]ERI11526.1 hypothetical protein HMPREF0083_00373 [Aneurinibacillus aneurinilyticus ATCC 12856]MCI1696760.1 geobacillin-26 family protein [Aneurinibacillus aneurinilyticus]MED0709320.1 geobacillin-26 family protein [Aneurinibacillus aneurinilyticus]MED0726134.1 geobacillin-26 family protein [Aneurinibacillus aneurinilyticus]MED0734586.1 geobacillin-26 family protein [Aneurinibacillus aneurinilyticus]